MIVCVEPGEREQFLGILFRDWRSELAGVNELQLRRLFGYGRGNLRHAVADEVDRGRSGEIEIFVAVGVPDVDTFAADRRGEILAERSAEDGRTGRHGRGFTHS